MQESFIGCSHSILTTAVIGRRVGKSGKLHRWQLSMTARVITYLLIALLLGCPFVCLRQNAEAGAADVLAVVCACCSDERLSQQHPSEQYPSDGAPESGRQNCPCKGAVVQAPSRATDLDLHCNAFWCFAADILSPAVCHRDLAGGADGSHSVVSHFPPLSSGQDVRALISSRLL